VACIGLSSFMRLRSLAQNTTEFEEEKGRGRVLSSHTLRPLRCACNELGCKCPLTGWDQSKILQQSLVQACIIVAFYAS